ncbi:PQQ-dependent sugar dehydrogenase [Krasilnikoviella flava]|uniref:Glucose/arabinose dehydrogenase, beta-propeller fold n=1 Tax=Krasilnikoviella flava TaxID=526729 RepID=A0A1T5IGE2_9MICO|nr:PQQ-dependent sugar dehydrogenase [Krasilnikoviella flava]SKC38083.1 Glucose/arabinose dehydrogenase, beta-propeller fold [Krasilnikoviella flava]
MSRHLLRRASVAAPAMGLMIVLAACGGTGGEPSAGPGTSATSGTGGGPTATVPPSPAATPQVTVETVVDDLDVPWGLAPLPDGTLLISLRDEARLVVVDPEAGTTTDVGGPGAEALATQTTPDGEGGLLGVARDPASGDVFVYRTGADDNAVLRGTLEGTVLGELTTVLDGIPRAGHHDGGGLAFGPDGFLYVGTGDAGDGEASQDPASLAGKILRVTPDGEPAPANPDPASPVWTLGHRNVQGLGWDAAGRMFASEFGQNTWDELNQIEPGGDYGWPDVEGPDGAGDGTVAPVRWWSTADASPSGLAVTDDAVYLAGLRGERLWRVPFGGTASGADEEGDEAGGPSKGAVDADGSVRPLGEPRALLEGELGRLRNVAPVVPGGGDADGLWVLTNNTDGRGSPRDGDDRLVRVTFG